MIDKEKFKRKHIFDKLLNLQTLIDVKIPSSQKIIHWPNMNEKFTSQELLVGKVDEQIDEEKQKRINL